MNKADLISRKDLDEAFTNLRWESDGKTLAHIGDRPSWCLQGNEIELMIKKVPSAPAVPLDDLCEWLADNAYMYLSEEELDNGWSSHDPAYWEMKLSKWMEEQNG